MTKLLATVFALAIIPTIVACSAQAVNAQQKPQEHPECTSIGLYFQNYASSRDQGISMKEQLDISAKVSQEVKVEGYNPMQLVYMTFVIITNVYTNTQYKPFGPEMNKMLAEYRCNKIGFEAHWEELMKFSKGER